MHAWQRGEVVVVPARATVARSDSCNDGGSGRKQGLLCRALVAAAAQGAGNGRALSCEEGGEAVGNMTKK